MKNFWKKNVLVIIVIQSIILLLFKVEVFNCWYSFYLKCEFLFPLNSQKNIFGKGTK